MLTWLNLRAMMPSSPSEAEEMAIRASAAIISCLEISTLMKGIEMIRSALIKLGTVK